MHAAWLWTCNLDIEWKPHVVNCNSKHVGWVGSSLSLSLMFPSDSLAKGLTTTCSWLANHTDIQTAVTFR